MKVLIVGSGGREHALAWKIGQSPLLTKLFVAPGNGGTQHYTNHNIEIEMTDVGGLVKFAKKEKIDLTIVGSEESLQLNIVDAFRNKDLKIFGPSGHDVQIETSKSFAKAIMQLEGIPTAPFKFLSDYHEALKHISTKNYPLVIKANGLARGKGVRVCSNDLDAVSFLQDLMIDKVCGEAGRVVIIEDYLEGEEYSAHALVSGETIVPFPMSQDYKKFNGQNTGGMGAIAPVLTDSKDFLDELTNTVTKPVIDHLAKFKGHSPIYDSAMCIYPGLMITSEGLRVLEFNARFGDPEEQVYMRLLKSDLLEVLLACVDGRLSEVKIEWYENLHAVCVVLASGGYPGKYKTGYPIRNVKKVSGLKGVKVFHAGTAYKNGKLVTVGGRVLNVTATGSTLEKARARAYEAVDEIYFEGMQYRKDIGLVSSHYQGT